MNDNPRTNPRTHPRTNPLTRPEPRVPIRIRVATFDDFESIDALHKKHTRSIGFWHRSKLEGYIKQEKILIAEEGANLLGFIIYTDRYKEHEDIGCIYAVCVDEQKHRRLIGAMLVQEVFDRAAYGCKLFCCWCAQDLRAGYFWESIGFVPIAFRAGSERKKRLHIFWQKRVRAEDITTPYWYPSVTRGGAIKEGRLVLPIPPGTHWTDAKPLVLPGVQEFEATDPHLLVGEDSHPKKKKRTKKKKQQIAERQVVKRCRDLSRIKPQFESPEQREARLAFEAEAAEEQERTAAQKQAKNAAKCKAKQPRTYEKKYLNAARELCARYMEQVNHAPGGDDRFVFDVTTQKYDVSRQIETSVGLKGLLPPGMGEDGDGLSAMQLPASDAIIDAKFTVRDAA